VQWRWVGQGVGCNGDEWAEGWGAMEMGGPVDEAQWRRVGRGYRVQWIRVGWYVKHNGDEWAGT
jgi:hypothetical protein